MRKCLSVLIAIGLVMSVFSGVIVPVPTVSAHADDGLIISEYIEGTSYNKAIELYNGTLGSIDLSAYKIVLYSNGATTPTSTLVLSGTLARGATIVVSRTDAIPAIVAAATLFSSTVINWNGDDAVALERVVDSSKVDVLGQIGFRPASPSCWGVSPCRTMDQTLVRKSSVMKGDPDGSNVFDPALQWDGYAVNDASYLGSHTMTDQGFIISEYIEGSSYNKAIELYNGRGIPIDLSMYKLCLYANGAGSASKTLLLTGTLAAGDTYVIAHASAAPAILAVADLTNAADYLAPDAVINFNGDDAVGLERVADSSKVDVFGQIGFDPGTYWGTSADSTLDHTLVRKPTVLKGDADGSNAFDPAPEWLFYANNTFTYLGAHVMTGGSAPTLTWTGEAGYVSDGVEPNTGDYPVTAVYRVTYTDADNDAPRGGYPVVHILKGGIEVAGSPFAMAQVDAGDTTYTDGKVYGYSKALKPGTYSYSFEAEDYGGAGATGVPLGTAVGPVVAGDSTPPDAYGFTPQRYSTIYEKRPTISADFSDTESPIDTSSVVITVDAVNVTSLSAVTSTGVTYSPAADLALGTHTVAISVSDTIGNIKSASWYFSVIQPLTTPGHYLGDIHSHTSYSDGASTPADAFTYARDTADIDFLAVTDHSNSLNTTEWTDTQTQADAFTQNGTFVGLAGFEYTNSAEGHANVYNTSTYVSRNDANYDTLAEFYTWLKSQPDAIAEFNHPFTLQDFGSFSYDPAVDQKVTMQEVGNGSPPYSYAVLEAAYIYALDKGWHVAATNNQDNHGANWGYPPNNLTGIIASSLTEADILAAMKAMRTYGTEDRNLQLSFLANGYWMGSTIPSTVGETITFHVDLLDPDSTDRIVSVQIITTGGKVLASMTANASTVAWDYPYTNPGGGNWYYVKAVEADGDIAISSPVWTPPADIDLRVTSLTSSPSVAFPNEPLTLTATVNNFGVFAYNSLTVDFYLGDPTDGGTLVGTGSVDVAVGGSDTVSASWTPTASGDVTLYAVLSGPTEDPVVDNTAMLTIKVIEANDHTVLIDRYHNNDYTSTTGLYNLTEFADLLKKNGYKVLENSALITSTTLQDVDLLIVPFPQGGSSKRDISADEKTAISAFVSGGGALLFAGDSNYGGEDPTTYNAFLTSMGVGINLNHDNVYDDVNNYGYQWSLNVLNFPETASGVGDGITRVRFFSGDTLITPAKGPLVSDPAQGIEVLAFANQTSWNEDDTTDLTHVGPGYYTYSYHSSPAGSLMPTMAVQTLPNGSRVAVLGRSIFSNYEMGNWVNEQAACNNEAFSLNLVDWLCSYERVLTIAEARQDLNADGIPDRLGQMVTIKGTVTAASGTFFDVTYLQDATGGITVFGAIPSDTILPLGAVLQVKGTIDAYNGDTELAFTSFADDFVWVGWAPELAPKTFNTGPLDTEGNEGWLVKSEGFVTQIIDGGTCIIDDGSGPIVVFVDGYVGSLPAGLRVGDYMSCVGLSGEYAFGRRIRVRNPSEVSIVFAVDAFIVTVTAGEHGTVTPGSGRLAYHATQEYLVKPHPGYLIDTLIVDGVVVKEAAWKTDFTVTFTGIESNHTISATFRPIPDMLAPTITLPDFSKLAGITGWSGGAVPTFTVGASPFPLTFMLEDNSGSAKWTITVNGVVVIDPVGTGSITFLVPLTEGRNDVEVSASDASGNYTSQRLIIYLDSTGPVLAMDPALPATVTKPELTIIGTVVDNISGLKLFTINDTRVVPFLDGSFSEKILLAKGANTIVIEAEDKVGHKVSATYVVTYATVLPPVFTAKTVTLTIGKAEMDVNGMPVALDAAPVIQNGRTLLPLRALIETLGGKVIWNGTTRMATVTLGSRTVAVTIGDPMGLVGGKKVAIDPANAKVVPVIINGRTMLPLRFIAENLGLDLAWDAATRTISFTYWP
jgi:hypothetical protein